VKRTILIGPDTKIVNLGGRPPRAVLTLLVVQLGLFLAWAFADAPPWVGKHLAVSAPQLFGQRELWQPLTALWIHVSGRAAVLNLLTLWMFGSALERWWGSRRFVIFFVVTGSLGLLAAGVVGLAFPARVVSGCSGSATAMLLAFGLLFPQHLVFFYGVLPIKAKYLGPIFLGFIVLGSLFGLDYLELAVQLGGAIAALPFLFRRGTPRPPRRRDSHLKVVDGGQKKERLWN
jgi:membrane associated rhomboid family serine protease